MDSSSSSSPSSSSTRPIPHSSRPPHVRAQDSASPQGSAIPLHLKATDMDSNRTGVHGDKNHSNSAVAQANGGNHPPGLSAQERQAAASAPAPAPAANNTNGTSQGSLSLSITPPSRLPPSSSSSLPDRPASPPKGTNGGSQDSLGPPPSLNLGLRRASLSLSAGSLNFPPGSSSSMASPSSPSYSTIAVARARAAAAAAEGAGGGLGGIGEEGEPGGGAQGAFGSPASGVIDSGVFSGQNPFLGSLHDRSPPPSSSSSVSSFRPRSVPQPPPPPRSVNSSSSSLNSNASGTSIHSQSEPSNHLQDNFKAEREVSMILPDFLYLGGELVEEDQILELERLGIQRVLNMAENCNDELWIQRSESSGSSERYLKVGLRDHVDQDLKDGLDKAIKFIAASKTPVYVHCQAGKSRSVATVIGYLIQEHRWPLKKAYDHVVERRRCMSPNIGFVSQLIMLEERVLGADQAGGLVSVAETDDVDPSSRTTVMPWTTS
ncbi:hypothetical protein EMPS_01847 [Entomortierella parvispora]|uniref:protein-tyrosine-phosphatase n=1 Tax=Entomortierella parvispora TaxID=205924 RepID=A0A9P3H3L3_9FUNG|nr:hypothetical protein EMPS_01847 [Entomortierella parvispora]